MLRLTNTRIALVLVFLMAVAGGLFIFYFSHQSLRLDESQSLWESSRSPAGILTVVSQDVHVPLYHELLHFWRLYISDSVVGARAMSLLFYILSIPGLYFLGKLAYSRSAGLLAAALFTISPFMNWYASEIRMYTLFCFFVIVNQYAFLRLWKGATRTGDGSEHAWAAYIVSALLGIYSHYFFFLLLGTQAIFYFIHSELFPKGSLKRFIFAAAIVTIAFAPWAAYVLLQGQAANQAPVLAHPTTVDLFSTFAQFVFGFQSDNLNTFVLSLWPLALLMGFFALRTRSRFTPETEYFILSVILPIAAVFAVSFFIPLFVSRYLIFTVPALYLLITSLFASYPMRAANVARGGLAAAMVVMLVIEMINPATPVKENYEGAADYLTANAKAQDAIVLSAPFTVYPVEYYYTGSSQITTLPAWDRYAYGAIPSFSEATLPQQVASTTADHQNVWLLLSYDQGYQSNIKDYFDSHYQMLQHVNFSPNLDLYEYQIQYDQLSQLEASSTAMAK